MLRTLCLVAVLVCLATAAFGQQPWGGERKKYPNPICQQDHPWDGVTRDDCTPYGPPAETVTNCGCDQPQVKDPPEPPVDWCRVLASAYAIVIGSNQSEQILAGCLGFRYGF